MRAEGVQRAMAASVALRGPLTGSAEFHGALKRYWGYDAFRPKQLEVIEALSAGRDVCVVMPTGGGKSLCYQLPAALEEGRTAVVISPLIALMQDQVAQLGQMGIAAVFLNSAVEGMERQKVKEKAIRGEYRLLYVSPERAVMEGTATWLRKVPISFFAIDEAHCISEWGHDFRPEYRQLKKLREQFPERPIAAFTASATQKVRHDIVEQLQLREPFKSVSSFRRENLRYVVKKCETGLQAQYLLQAVRDIPEGNLIIYVPTVKRVGETVEFLKENGLDAVGYHGQMDTATRERNQGKWSNEEVRIVVATIAFGLGINKKNVRGVIHLALPKSIEHYYQESGRAGRDGEPAVCILLWRGADLGLLGHFNKQISNAEERDHAWERYRAIEAYAKSEKCRKLQLCQHFGERPSWENCEGCDVCAGKYHWDEAPKAALKQRFESPAMMETLRMMEAGKSFGEIAAERDIQISSVCDMVGKLVEDGRLEFKDDWLDAEKLELISAASKRLGLKLLKPIKEELPEAISYGEIRLVVGHLRREMGWSYAP